MLNGKVGRSDLGAVRSWLGGGENPFSEADAGCPELGSHADECSRSRAARELAATVPSRMAGAKVARGMERAMRP